MSGSRRCYQDRPPHGTTEEYFEDIEPADFRLPSPREELIENPNAEPLVRHLAQDDSAGGRGREEETLQSHHEYYSRISQNPTHRRQRDRSYPVYRYSERRENPRWHRADTAHTGSVEQASSDPYMIRNVSSSAGESVTSQRYWPPHDAHSFDSQHHSDHLYYSRRVTSRYPTPPPAQHFRQQSNLATSYASDEYHDRLRHSYPVHGSYFSPVGDNAQRGELLETEAIKEINENDVICGRGGAANTHSGNRSFREFVKKNQPRYLKSKKKDKPAVAEFIVKHIKQLTPPGRFVKKDQRTGLWYEVSDERAREKASQALREGAAAKRRGKEKEGDSSHRISTPTADGDDSNDTDDDDEEEHSRTVPGASKPTKAEMIEKASTDDKHDHVSASGQEEPGDGTADDDEPHEPVDIEDDESSCSVSSGGSSLSTRAIPKRVVIIRPALELRRCQLAAVDVAALSEEEKVLYIDSFTPPAYSPSTVVSDTVGQRS